MMVRVQAHSRAHLGLISLHKTARRRHGGIGFMLESPVVVVTGERSSAKVIRDARGLPLGLGELTDLENALQAVCELMRIDGGWNIEIHGALSTHIGLGSGTAIRMAAIECLCTLYGLPFTRESIQVWSRRGGVSGIGIHGYFDGGAILDLGARNSDAPLLPSSAQVPARIPLQLIRSPMPPWKIAVVTPKTFEPVSRDRELKLFRNTLPLAANDSLQALEIVVMEIMASILEQDLDGFAHGLNRMQSTSWKQAERELHGYEIERIDTGLRSLGAAGVALSSIGPSLVAVGSDMFHALLAERSEALGVDVVTTRPSNHGRAIL